MSSDDTFKAGEPVNKELVGPVRATPAVPGVAPHVEQRYQSAFRNPAIAFGTNFAAAMALCAYGGHRLDQYLGTGETFLLSGVGIALLYAVYELWKIVRAQNQSSSGEVPRASTPVSSTPKPPPPTSPSC